MLRGTYGHESVLDVLSTLYTETLRDERRDLARSAAKSEEAGSASGSGRAAARRLRWRQPATFQLVYGEFDPDFFARLIEAAKLTEAGKEIFVDLGSGAGRLVLSAALLKPALWKRCIGLEVLSELHLQALAAAELLPDLLAVHSSHNAPSSSSSKLAAPCRFHCVDLFDPHGEAPHFLCTATCCMAYAITWAADDMGRLTTLSDLLGATLPDGARVLTVDLQLMDTPRLCFQLMAMERGWNAETGDTTGYVYRAHIVRKPVVTQADVDENDAASTIQLISHVYPVVRTVKRKGMSDRHASVDIKLELSVWWRQAWRRKRRQT